ncbi:hypothetical protein AEA09_16580 [Lysinibacillus contaminans]|uniref:GntR family transcriptional regulator n=1 Tax=Lysinibacillus contaminans TaxID=1293441 RepID=A0ABR5JWG1_9BACI|nr:hypothetical protein [Lysinibacillus contaminans]KOS66365.1 hypothetical protein AEA09_16580 [Lysinibacillus contaminans]
MKLPKRLSEDEAIRRGLSVGVQVYPCSTSFQSSTDNHMVLIGYGGLTLKEIENGVALLAMAWQ